jgi:hypothetical protein
MDLVAEEFEVGGADVCRGWLGLPKSGSKGLSLNELSEDMTG